MKQQSIRRDKQTYVHTVRVIRVILSNVIILLEYFCKALKMYQFQFRHFLSNYRFCPCKSSLVQPICLTKSTGHVDTIQR